MSLTRVRTLGLALTAAVSLAACGSTEDVVSGQPGEEIAADEAPVVDESPTTTAAVRTSVSAPTTDTAPSTTTTIATTSTSLAPDVAVEDQEHLTRPWFPDVEGPVEHIRFFTNPPEFFSSATFDEFGCPASEAYELIDDSMTFRRDVSWADIGWNQSSGYVPDGASTTALIDSVIDSGTCFDAAAIATGEVAFASTSRGPAVEGIANSAVIHFTEDAAELQIVLASTGGRDLHFIGTFTRAEFPTGDEISDANLIALLEDIVARAPDAAERVSFCTETVPEPAPFAAIDDQRCDGFEQYSPELGLRPYRSNTIVDAANVTINPPTTTTTTTTPPSPEELTEQFVEDFNITPTWTLLISATDLGPGAPSVVSPATPSPTSVCEAELGEKARVGNQFDQWLQIETQIEDTAAEERILHVIGEAPTPTEAVEAVNALASYGSCAELDQIFGGPLVSTALVTLPPGVAAGTIWEVDTPGQPTVVGDFALADGTVMAISVRSPTVTPDRILELLDLSLSKQDQ